MKWRKFWLLSIIVVLLASSAMPASAEPARAPLLRAVTQEAVPEQYIVVYKADSVAQAGVEQLMGQVHDLGVTEKYVYQEAIQGFAATLSDAELDALRQNPAVAYIEEDQVMKISATRQKDVTWGLDRISQRKLPLNNVFTFKSTGKGVTAYIIDTGTTPSHADFSGRAKVGMDAMNDGQNGIDCHGHGTHVAGTIGGETYGVAKDVSIVGVRVLDCFGSGTVSSVVAGIDWVTRNHVSGTPGVANMSLGGMPSDTLDTAIENSINDGITFVVAAGNSNADACDGSPSRVKDAITVGATDDTDTRAPWSNFGSCLDIFAPGVQITSDWPDNLTKILSGTSMASPHVAGVAALYLSTHPKASPGEVVDRLTSNATKGVVKDAGSGSPKILLFEYD